MLKRTPLYPTHQQLGARLVEFGGWEMPLHYTSIVDEHTTVRNAAGLFDISHMGQLRIQGPAALPFLNRLLTNDASRLDVGQGQYTLMCNEHGGVIDDLYLYRIAPDAYLLVINASRIETDLAWLRFQLQSGDPGNAVQLLNLSPACAALAIQGPFVAQFIEPCFPEGRAQPDPSDPIANLSKNSIARVRFAGTTLLVARTGYTGEDGFEVFTPAESIEHLWKCLLHHGQPFGLKPCGLGARDTLRTEMAYPLHGHEIDESTSPLEAGLGSFVALSKSHFIGHAALSQQKTKGTEKKCVAFKLTHKAPPPRPGYPLWSTGPNPAPVGRVVSGTQSPSLGVGIGLGYVPTALAKPGNTLTVEIRNRQFPALIVPKPIYQPKKSR
jgi:aminomethyltransferase